MNKRKIGRDFEIEAFKILKNHFDIVEWMSERTKSVFDFKCIKDGKIYFGDAKVNNKLLTKNQENADFLIWKKNGKVELIFKKDFEKKKVYIEDKVYTTIRVNRSIVEDFRKIYREYPRETDEQILIKLIQKELSGRDTQQPSHSK
jgi:hypothetical protein